jgi:hypothetical protein
MANENLHWEAATLTWAPEVAREAIILRIPAFIERYAALNLEDALNEQLPALAGSEGRLLSVEVQPGERLEDAASVSFEPGQVVIVAERLMRCFDAGQLREQIAALAEQAVEVGDREAKADSDAASAFLNDLAVEP